MKLLKLLFLLLLATPAYSQTTGYTIRDDCGTLSPTTAYSAVCAQRTTANGRTAGTVYIWTGATWEQISGSGSGFDEAGDFEPTGTWDFSGGTLTGIGSIHSDFADDDHTIYPYLTTGSGAPSAGTVSRAGHVYFDTTNEKFYLGFETGGNFTDIETLAAGPYQFTFDADAETFTGPGVITFTSGDSTITGTVSKTGTAPNEVITVDLRGGGAGGTGTKTVTRPMDMHSIEIGAANALVNSVNGTNIDYRGVQYADAATGKSYWGIRVGNDIHETPEWNLVLTSNPASGVGGDVSLTLACRAVAHNEARDSTMTYVFGASGNPAEKTLVTSANQTVTTISATDLDLTLAIAAGDYVYCEVARVGGDALDTLSAPWHLTDVSIQYVVTAGGSGSGDIESVVAGDGLTGGGITGAVTLNVGVTAPIEVSADAIACSTCVTTTDIPNSEQSELAALDVLGNGVVAKTGDATYSNRTITGTANQITVSNGDGVSGNPTLSITTSPTLPGTTSGTFSGNLTGNVTGDLTGDVTGNADTATLAAAATALAANGGNCGVGEAAQGVDASGTAENCFTPTAAAGGTDTQVQFNDGGTALGGDAGMTYNKTTDVLTVVGGVTGNASTATALAANGANCSAGSAPLGVDASGAVESCANYMEEPSSSGIVVRSAANTAVNRTITGTANNISVTNGDGVAGNPTIDVGTDVVLKDASNIYSTGAQDMGSATSLKVPTSAGAGPTASGLVAYDSTANTLEFGANGGNKIVATTDDVLTQTEADAVDFIVGTATGNLTGERVGTDTGTINVDIGTAGQVLWNVLATVNAQTNTSYEVLDADRGKLVTLTNASPIAVTLPQPGTASTFISGWFADFQNRGAGTATLTPGGTPPGALTAGTPTSGGSCTDGTHSYKVTFVSATIGESNAGTVSNVITCVLTSGQTVPLSGIPLGPAGTTSRKIYRTVAGDTGSYLLLTTIADNTTTIFSDTIADGSLGAAAPSYTIDGAASLALTTEQGIRVFSDGTNYFTQRGRVGANLIDASHIDETDNYTWTGIHSFAGATLSGASPIVLEGATANDFQTTLIVTDPTADRSITLPDATGEVSLLGQLIGTAELDDADCSDDEIWKKVAGAWACAADGGTVEADTLDTVFDRGKIIDGANSLANAFRVGDGTTPMCHYTDATLGPVVRPCTDSNVRTIIPTDFTWALYDIEGTAAMLTVDPDGTANAKYTWASGYRPTKRIWFGAGSLSTDGTQCAAPAEVTINSGPKIWTIICTDNDASTIYGSVKMPEEWDGGTVTFTHSYIQTAVDTAVLNGDIACQARSNGEVPSSTWGTEIAIDDAAVVGSNSNDMTTSAAVTCAGTGLAGGDMLYFRYQLDATGTTTAVATLHHVGFGINYTISTGF